MSTFKEIPAPTAVQVVLSAIQDLISAQAVKIPLASSTDSVLALRKLSSPKTSVKLVAALVQPVSMATSVRHAQQTSLSEILSACSVQAVRKFKVMDVLNPVVVMDLTEVMEQTVTVHSNLQTVKIVETKLETREMAQLPVTLQLVKNRKLNLIVARL